MRTDDLVGLLSTGITPVRRGTAARRFGISLPVATLGATALMAIVFGVRPDLGAVVKTPIFWEKLAFPLCLAIGALIASLDRCNRDCCHRGAGRPAACATRALVAVMSVQYSSARRSRLHRHTLGRQRSGAHESEVCRCCLRAAREFDRHSRVLLSLS
jgi:hypothetical protein